MIFNGSMVQRWIFNGGTILDFFKMIEEESQKQCDRFLEKMRAGAVSNGADGDQ